SSWATLSTAPSNSWRTTGRRSSTSTRTWPPGRGRPWPASSKGPACPSPAPTSRDCVSDASWVRAAGGHGPSRTPARPALTGEEPFPVEEAGEPPPPEAVDHCNHHPGNNEDLDRGRHRPVGDGGQPAHHRQRDQAGQLLGHAD